MQGGGRRRATTAAVAGPPNRGPTASGSPAGHWRLLQASSTAAPHSRRRSFGRARAPAWRLASPEGATADSDHFASLQNDLSAKRPVGILMWPSGSCAGSCAASGHQNAVEVRPLKDPFNSQPGLCKQPEDRMTPHVHAHHRLIQTARVRTHAGRQRRRARHLRDAATSAGSLPSHRASSCTAQVEMRCGHPGVLLGAGVGGPPADAALRPHAHPRGRQAAHGRGTLPFKQPSAPILASRGAGDHGALETGPGARRGARRER